jgi:hypothetical protein
MSKVLVVTMEWPRSTGTITERIPIDGTESDEELQEIASDAFCNYANYGYEVEEGHADDE